MCVCVCVGGGGGRARRTRAQHVVAVAQARVLRHVRDSVPEANGLVATARGQSRAVGAAGRGTGGKEVSYGRK